MVKNGKSRPYWVIFEKPVLKVKEVSELFGVHPDTIRRWDKDGSLRADRTPKGTRIYPVSKLKKHMSILKR